MIFHSVFVWTLEFFGSDGMMEDFLVGADRKILQVIQMSRWECEGEGFFIPVDSFVDDTEYRKKMYCYMASLSPFGMTFIKIKHEDGHILYAEFMCEGILKLNLDSEGLIDSYEIVER